MPDNTISWVIEIGIKTGELDNFKSLMQEMVESTLVNEPGTQCFEWFISDDNKSCHIYERYEDSDAVMTHLGAFGEKFAERILAISEPTRFMVYGNPSEEARKALGGFGAVFWAPIGGFAR